MENQNNTPTATGLSFTQPPVVKQPETIAMLNHDELLAALFFFWDGFERSTMNFFVVKDTAKQVIAGQELAGDKLTLGIRKLEWQGGQQRIFKAFMEHEKINPVDKGKNYLRFIYKTVPVYLYIYEDNPCISSLDVVFYKNETFNTPNPFKRFCEEFDK